MVKGHVEEGAKHIAKQRALIAHLEQEKLPTQEAEALLVTIEILQHQHEDHLTRTLAKRG